MAILRDPPFHIAAPLNAATRLFSSPGRAETRKAVHEACTINVIDALTSQGARYVPISSASFFSIGSLPWLDSGPQKHDASVADVHTNIYLKVFWEV